MLTISYTNLQLNRGGDSRKDVSWIKSQWGHPGARVIPMWQDKSPMINSDLQSRALLLTAGLVSSHVEDWQQSVYLGEDDQGPIFALGFEHSSEPALPFLEAEASWTDLRQIGWMLDHQEAALLAFARGMIYWNRHHLFCGSCGHATESEQGGHVRRCGNQDCGRTHFPRTDPAVIMLVEDRSDPDNPRCLLARNARFPFKMMSTLAGFVDPMESLEETVAREVFEESGIRVDQVKYQASQPWPFPSSIMLGFRANATTVEINVDGVEIEEAHWFTPDQLAGFGEWGDDDDNFSLPRKDSIARFLIDDWVREVTGKGSNT